MARSTRRLPHEMRDGGAIARAPPPPSSASPSRLRSPLPPQVRVLKERGKRGSEAKEALKAVIAAQNDKSAALSEEVAELARCDLMRRCPQMF